MKLLLKLQSILRSNKTWTRELLDLGANYNLQNQEGTAQFFFNYYLPFIQTPTNVAGFVLERFPIANLALTDTKRSFFKNKVLRDHKR